MKRLISTLLVVLATVGAFGYLVAQPSLVAAQGSAALSIVPKKNYTIEPGKSINDTLVVRNLDREQPLYLNLRVVDFTFHDETGTPKLMLEEDAPQTTWSLKPFLKIPKQVTIEPSSTQTLDMSVSIPANHGAGDYYSAIVYSTSSSEGGNVGLSASGVSLVFTKIPGDVNENLVLEGIGAYDSVAKRYRYFNDQQPLRIGYTIKNEGNVTASPVGSITLRNLFGQETVINNINPNQSLALIGQTRTFEPCIKLAKEEVDFAGSRTQASTCADGGLWPGFYSVELDAFYGQNGNNTRSLVGKGSFWYLPWWFVLISLAVLAYLAFRIWRIVRYFRKRQGRTQSPKRKISRK